MSGWGRLGRYAAGYRFSTRSGHKGSKRLSQSGEVVGSTRVDEDDDEDEDDEETVKTSEVGCVGEGLRRLASD